MLEITQTSPAAYILVGRVCVQFIIHQNNSPHQVTHTEPFGLRKLPPDGLTRSASEVPTWRGTCWGQHVGCVHSCVHLEALEIKQFMDGDLRARLAAHKPKDCFRQPPVHEPLC